MTKRILSILLLLAYPLSARFYIGIEGGYARNLGVFDIRQNNLNPLNLKKEILREDGMIGNVVLGTEHFFLKNYLGIRWGVFAGYGQTWGKNDTYGNISTSVVAAGVSADTIINFIAKENLTAGFIIGMEYSYNTFKPNKKIQYGAHFSTSFPIYAPGQPITPAYVYKGEDDCYTNNQARYWTPTLRVGTSVLLNKHHRVEFFAKLPLKTFSKSNSFNFEYNNILWNPKHQKYDTKVSYAHSFFQAFVSYKYVF